MTQRIFKHKTPNIPKLLSYGFRAAENGYIFETDVAEGQFRLRVSVTESGEVETVLTDVLTDEPYTLHLVAEASGAFVGRVRTEFEKALQEIAENCFETEIFKSDYAKKLIGYVREKYGIDPEYLWEKFPENAIWRRKDNQKWYGAILTTDGKKFGREGSVELLDMRMETEMLERMVDDKNYFRGWHMNKKHWVTVLLDGSVSLEEIFRMIDNSYLLAKK